MSRTIGHRAVTAAADAVTIDMRLPTWLETEHQRTRDGYPTSSGGRTSTGGDHSDPTLNAAIANTTGTGPGYRPVDRINLVTEMHTAITRAWAELADQQRALLDLLRIERPRTETHPTPRCDGNHLPGAHVPISAGGWHDPTCSNDAELYTRQDGTVTLRRNGLCGACSKRYTRWSGTELDTSGAASIAGEVPVVPQDRRNPGEMGNDTPNTGEGK